MSDFWETLGKTIGKTGQALDEARKEAERLAREAARGVAGTVEQAQQIFTGQPAGEPVEIAALPEYQRVAFAGALYALAAADGTLDKEELQLIVDLVDLSGLSPAGRQMALGFILEQPALGDALAPLAGAPEAVRFALLLNLIELALANDLLSPRQDALLAAARVDLGVSEEQNRALWRFVRELRAVRLRGADDPTAAQLTRTAAAGLAAVGVPLAAVYVSGSVIGLSAAGITSGLAALGLGLGMVPGIGVAVLLGTGAFLGVRALLSAVSAEEPAQLRRAVAERAQAVLVSLDELVALLDQRIAAVERAADSTANGLLLAGLHERRRALLQIAARRRALAERLD